MQAARETLEAAGIYPIKIPTPFMVGPVNVYLIKRDTPVLIDTGPNTKEAFEVLTRDLEQHGVVLADIARVYITHAHVDHCGLLARVIEASGAMTCAHPEVAAALSPDSIDSSDNAGTVADRLRVFGVPEDAMDTLLDPGAEYRQYASAAHIDTTVSDGQIYEGFTARFVPGHSASDTLWVSEMPANGGSLGLAFSGDHVLKTMNPNPLLRRPRQDGTRVSSLIQFRESLMRTREMDLAMLCPGHGEPLRDWRRVIDGILRRHERRCSEILKLLAHGALTPFGIMMKLYPELEPGHWFLGLSAAVGHLELLEARGKVRLERRNGCLYATNLSTNS